MGFFSAFRGGPDSDEIEAYLEEGAKVIDVRTEPEFFNGHAEGSKNIPLNTVPYNIEEIKAFNRPVITCCRSGARSGSAASILKQNGVDAINGGPWQDVAACIK